MPYFAGQQIVFDNQGRRDDKRKMLSYHSCSFDHGTSSVTGTLDGESD